MQLGFIGTGEIYGVNRQRPVLVWHHIAFDSLVPAQFCRREGAFQVASGAFPLLRPTRKFSIIPTQSLSQ